MRHRSRRQFLRGGLGLAGLGLLAGCGVLPSASRPPPKVPRIGILVPGSPENAVAVEPTRDGLRGLGYVEGETIAIEWRFAEGRIERLPALADELAGLDLELIVAVSTPAALAAQAATATVPIVFAAATDALGSGLVDGLGRPGGNLTGTTDVGPEIHGKRLELLKELLPGLSRAAVLWWTADRRQGDFEAVRDAAGKLGVRPLVVEVDAPGDFEGAIAAAAGQGAEALLTIGSNAVMAHLVAIAELALGHRLPAASHYRAFAAAGGLLAYGPNNPAQHRRTATYVDRILKGAKPADLPVEQPTTFDLVLNLRTAQAFALTIPPSFLMHVTEVIQ